MRRSCTPRSISFWVPALVVALLILGASGLASAEPDRELADFEGDWRQLDPDVDRQSRMTAIDEAIGGLSWVMRKMAGSVLRRSLDPAPRIQFIWDGRQLEQRVVESGGRLRENAIEFGKVSVDEDDSRGSLMTASWQWTGSGLRLNWTQNQAHGHNLYRLDPETQTMVVEHTVQVTAISDVEPIVFESRFGRRDPPSVSSGLDPVDPATESSVEAPL